MANATLESVVRCDPEVLGGTPVFVGTRVPVKNLFGLDPPRIRLLPKAISPMMFLHYVGTS